LSGFLDFPQKGFSGRGLAEVRDGKLYIKAGSDIGISAGMQFDVRSNPTSCNFVRKAEAGNTHIQSGAIGMSTRTLIALSLGIVIPGAVGSLAAQGAARRPAALDRCSLVTESEAEKILGKRLAAPQTQPNRDCWYLREGGSGFGAVEFIISVPPGQVKSEKDFHTMIADQVKRMNARLKKRGAGIPGMPEFTATPAPGVGAPAYFIDPGLYALKGNTVLVVGLGGAKGVAIAKTALKRMP
jgi:hypothetical protein